MYRQSLNGRWEFRRPGDGAWRDATVPGGVYSDLLDAGEIDDPYYADNELDVQWVGESDWEYRRTVTVPADALDEDRVLLRCDGLDTVATVSVNGTWVGSSDNMHRGYEFDVADELTPGENRIAVRFRSPVKYGVERRREYPYEVPRIRYPVDRSAVNFVRKAQCHYGWDWGPCLPTIGIWRDIELVAYSAPVVDYTATEQSHREDGSVGLSVRVGVDAPTATDAEVAASVADAEATAAVELAAGDSEVVLDLDVADPDLWWPNGHGDQSLYDLEVAVTADGRTHTSTDRVGFRDFEVVREPDDAGESFYFAVNGEPIFAKGANWIPVDALHGRVTDERVAGLLDDAAAANMNTIRVWGGGYYEREAFYERCDELGLLVWQDFMFACSLYPADEDFLETVAAEVRYQVRRLATHPSIALWCGNNENEEALENWFADRDHHDRLREDYERLYDDTVGEVVAEEDPGRTYWPASPSSGEDVDDPYEMGRGDVHYWDVWHEGAPFSDYETIEPRFVSEFGYQSFPPTDVLADAVPESDFNPTAPLMEHHQRHERGNRIVLQQMADAFRIPFSFEGFVYLSQVQQALAMRTAIEHFRRLRPHCMGALYWQLNDVWPCASWSSIAYGGEWKALQYVARRVFAPALVSTVATDAGIEVWVTNDTADRLDGDLELLVASLDGGESTARTEAVSVDAYGSEPVATVDPDAVDAAPDSTLVRARYGAGVESYPAFHFGPEYKGLDLPETDVRTSVDGRRITVETDAAALFVALDVDGVEGTLSDNYFHLAPGERRTLTLDADGVDEAAVREGLAVTHLRETY